MEVELQSWKQHLIKEAIQARKRARASYSKFQVGAALLAASGKIITGANVESASYGLTCCAERVTLFKALTEGMNHFQAMAVVARCSNGPSPCGACRQLLAEYAPDATIWVADTSRPTKIREFQVSELLPSPFL